MKRFAAMGLLVALFALAGSHASLAEAASSSDAPPTTSPGSGPAVTEQPTAGQRLMGDFAPKLRDLTDNVLFGDVWTRPDLSPRDRSLVTISALIAMNRPDQLRGHLVRARENGLTQAEVVEVITHLAFYAGWPSAITAIAVAKGVIQKP